MQNCRKCGLPLGFKRMPSGKLRPTNPDGSDHWDLCSFTRFKTSGKPTVVKMATTKAKKFNLPDCDCPEPPWEDCRHVAGGLDQEYREIMRSSL